MKVYVDELPKICKDCTCLNRVNGRCQLLHLYVDEDEKQEDCPLESIADHDKKVKDKLLEDVWEIMEKITFDWYEDDDNINSELYIDADDIADILTDFETMSKEEVIEKHKWRFDKSVENSQDTQKSSTGGEE